MAKKGSLDAWLAGKPAVGERRLFWSLVVTGSVDISYKYPHGPPLLHKSGGSTVWQALMTRGELESLREQLEQHGVTLQAFRQGRQEVLARQEDSSDLSLETQGKHEFVLEVDRTDPSQMVYPTEKCPLCFWFYPEGESHCGIQDWPLSMRDSAKSLPKAVMDKDQCPLHGEKDEL